MTSNNSLVVTKAIKTLKITLYGLLIIYLLIWLTSPFIFNYFINDYLRKNHSIELSDDSGIRYNPFTSHLTIRELELHKDGAAVFKLKSLEAEIRLHRFLIDQLYISEFNLDGLYLEVKNTKGQLQVAGVWSGTSDPVDKLADDTSVNNASVESSTPLKILLPKLDITNANIQYYQPGQDHYLSLDEINLRDFVLSSTNKTFKAKIGAVLDDAVVVIEFDTELHTDANNPKSIGEGNAKLTTVIKGYSLDKLGTITNTEDRTIAGVVSFEANYLFKIDNQQLAVTTDKTSIRLEHISYKDQASYFKQEFQVITFNKISTLLALNSENILQELIIESLVLDAGKSEFVRDGLSFENAGHILDLKNIRLRATDKAQFGLSFDQSNWHIQPLKLKQETQLLTSDGGILTINRLVADNKSLSVNKIDFEGLNAKYSIKASDSSDNEKVVSDESSETDGPSNKQKKSSTGLVEKAADVEEVDTSTSKMKILVDEIMLVNSKELVFEDESVKPTFKQSLLITEFNLTNLDSTQADNKSLFKFVGESGQYTKFDFEGFIKPFTAETNLGIKGKLTELSLPPASPYIEAAMGFQFESGALDTKIDVEVVESEISGNTEVLIKGLALVAADQYNKDALSQQKAMPLNVALGMLKDSDDNVELDIPLTGNVDNPDFGVSSFISLITKKAIQSAATSYLMKAFLPYAELISISISAGDFILKTRFEDLHYPPSQIEFDEQQKIYMQQFILLMKDKKDTQVKACAVSTKLDVNENAEILSEDDRVSQLKSISQKRMDYFKSYVVEQGIESARILLCSPKLDLEDKGEGKIEISI